VESAGCSGDPGETQSSLNPPGRELAYLGMKHNVGTWDRVVRAIAGLAMLTCSVMAPLPVLVRGCVLGVPGAYLLLTAVIGSCVGYRVLGKSTCALEARR